MIEKMVSKETQKDYCILIRIQRLVFLQRLY